MFSIKASIKGVSVTCVATIQIQYVELFSLTPPKMPVFQPWAFHIIFLIFWFSLPIDNFSIKGIWFRFISGLYPIINIWLYLSTQICCRIILVSFWVHFNIIPTCVIVASLFWSYVFQDTTTNHAYTHIIVNINFLYPYYIGIVMDSCRYMILSFLPREWMGHCVYLIWPCPGFSMIFRVKYFMSLQWYFRINT